MLQGFQAFLTLFGVIVIAISLAHMAIGPRAIIGGVAVNRRWLARTGSSPAGSDGPQLPVAQLAVVLDGIPHPFYVAMLVLELALPPLMVVVAKRVAKPANV